MSMTEQSGLFGKGLKKCPVASGAVYTVNGPTLCAING
jgi:hypothetical protein